jgi:SET domain-containing protein
MGLGSIENMKDRIIRQCSIFCLRSFLNHDRNKNVRFEYRDNVLMMYALRDIKEGEELVFDYCEGV